MDKTDREIKSVFYLVYEITNMHNCFYMTSWQTYKMLTAENK